MKNIVSTQGNEIKFNLSGERKLVISKTPISVDELELRILKERLGTQITVLSTPIEEVTPEEVTPEEVTPEEVTPEEVTAALDGLDETEEIV